MQKKSKSNRLFLPNTCIVVLCFERTDKEPFVDLEIADMLDTVDTIPERLSWNQFITVLLKIYVDDAHH